MKILKLNKIRKSASVDEINALEDDDCDIILSDGPRNIIGEPNFESINITNKPSITKAKDKEIERSRNNQIQLFT